MCDLRQPPLLSLTFSCRMKVQELLAGQVLPRPGAQLLAKRGVCLSPTADGSEHQQGMPLHSIPNSLVAPWLERKTHLCVGVAHSHAEGDGHHVGKLLSNASGETLLCLRGPVPAPGANPAVPRPRSASRLPAAAPCTPWT